MKTVVGHRGQLDARWDWRVPAGPDAEPALPRHVAQSGVRARQLAIAVRPRFPAAARRWLPVAAVALSAALLLSVAAVIGSSDTGDSRQAVLAAASPPGPAAANDAESAPGLSAASAGTTERISPSSNLPPVALPESAAGARIVAGLSARGGLVFIGFFLVILVLAAEVWILRHSEPRRSLGDALDD